MGREVFISYSSADAAQAETVCSGLETRGITCWMAPRDIRPGDSWAAGILEGINGSRLMVLVLSEHSNDSPYVQREVERFANRKLPIIPLRISDIEPSGMMEFLLCTPHWLDAFESDVSTMMDTLADIVRTFLLEAESASEMEPTPSATATTTTLPAGGSIAAAVVNVERSEQAMADAKADLRAHAERVFNVLTGVTNPEHRIDYGKLAARLQGTSEVSDAEVENLKHFLSDLKRNGLLPGVGLGPTEAYLTEQYISFKNGLQTDEKLSIARTCLTLIRSGDAVVLDAGSTTQRLADLLADEIREGRITDAAFLCFSPSHTERLLAAANQRGLIDGECGIVIYSPGGPVRLATKAIMVTDETESAIRSWTASLGKRIVGFVGTNGIKASEGFTTKTAAETRNKQLILDLADERVVIADSGKIGHVWGAKFADLDETITLVTNDRSEDTGLFEMALESIRSTGCVVRTC